MKWHNWTLTDWFVVTTAVGVFCVVLDATWAILQMAGETIQILWSQGW